MTAPAHTPGPWKRNGTLIESDAPSYIASVNYAGSVEETRANARLIAAAPELLAAVEAIHAGLVDGSIQFTNKRRSEADPYHPANTLMSRAIAKTRGETK